MACHLWISTLALVICVLSMRISPSLCVQHTVGDSIWSIPLTNNFYSNWSSTHLFHTGDTLYFDFDSPLYNVMEVSRREFDSCTANQAFKAFTYGPVTVALMEEGVFYFICNVSNYCSLGQKLSVTVQPNSLSPRPNPPSMLPQTAKPPAPSPTSKPAAG